MIDFKKYSELYHYGVKGMKWHWHKKGYGEYQPKRKSFREVVDSNREKTFDERQRELEEHGSKLTDMYNNKDYKGLLRSYKTNADTRMLVNGTLFYQMDDWKDKHIKKGSRGDKLYKNLRKTLKSATTAYDERQKRKPGGSRNSGSHRI